MIFIYEPQIKIDPNCLEEYIYFYALDEASRIYKFLYNLNLDLLEKINEVQVLYCDENKITYYKEVFANYSPRIEDCSKQVKIVLLNHENKGILPSSNEFIDPDKNDLIIRRIQKTKFIGIKSDLEPDFLSIINKEIIVNLQFTGEAFLKIIEKHKDRKKIKLFSNYENMNVKDLTGNMFIETDKYWNIVEQLRLLSKERNFSNPDDIGTDIYNYEPQRLINIFKDSLYRKISRIRDEDLTRLKIIGEDSYLTNIVIHEFVRGYNYLFYDLLEGIPLITKKTSSVFSNFDLIKDPIMYRDLYKNIQCINKNNYIMLQSSRKTYVDYFREYEDIDLPGSSEIQNTISEIILTLLKDNRVVLNGYYSAYMLVKKNSFAKLLFNIETIDNLDQILKLIRKFPIEELWQNAAMWYFIITELDKLKSNRGKREIDSVIVGYNKKEWLLFGLMENQSFKIPDGLGIKYMLTLIYLYYKHNYKEPIHATVLRTLVNAIDQKSPNDNYFDRDDYTNAKSIISCLESIALADHDNAPVQEFCLKHIKHSKNYFWFAPSDLKIFDLPDSIFNSELFHNLEKLIDNVVKDPNSKSKPQYNKKAIPKTYSVGKIDKNMPD